MGGQLEGTPADFTFSLPSYTSSYPDLYSTNASSDTSTISIPGVTSGSYSTAYTLGQPNISQETLLELVSQGLWPLAEKANDQIERTSDMKPVYDQTGMFERTIDRFNNMDQYYRPGEINGTLGGGQPSRYPDYLREKNIYKDIVSAREILDDIKFYPDLGSDEKNEARLDLLQMAIDREQKGAELGTDIAAWTAMTVVGGKAVEVGLKGVGAAAKPFINKLTKEGKEVVRESNYILESGDQWAVQAMDDNASSKITTRLLDNELEEFARAKGIDTDVSRFMEYDSDGSSSRIDVDSYFEYLTAQLADHPEISSIVSKLFNNSSSQNKEVIIDALQGGLGEDALTGATNLSDDIAKFLVSKGDLSLDLSKLPLNLIDYKKEVVEAINALRYESSGTFLQGLGGVNEAELKDALVYALIRREDGINRLKPVLKETQDRIEAVKDFCLQYGKGTDCGNVNVAAISGENKNIYSLDKDELEDIFRYYAPKLGSDERMPPGFHVVNDGAIIVSSSRFSVDVMAHECIHAACSVAVRQSAKKDLTTLLGKKDEAEALLEGINEFSSRLGDVLKDKGTVNYQDLKQASKRYYTEQVNFVVDILIPAIKKQNSSFLKKMKDEEAIAIVAEAGLTGSYEKVIKAAGGIDKVKKLLLDNPKVIETIPYKNRLSFEFVKPDPKPGFSMISQVFAAEPEKNTAEETLMTVDRLVTPFDVAFAKKEVRKLVQNSQEENPDQIAMDSAVFSLQIKKELIKQALSEDQNVSSSFVKDVEGMDILMPTVLEENNGYLLTTGETGIVEGNLAKGRYVISVDPLPGVDIEVPTVVDLNKGDVFVPIKVKQGSGQVKKVTFKKGWNLAGVVYADEKKDDINLAKVKVVLVSEDGGQVLPWAGLNIKLEKVDQEKTINLTAGWNLITLPGLPNKPLSASALLDEVNNQGGEAVVVSSLENGAWKSYVKRGEKDYSDSADNFIVESGKAYFVKALKSAKFNFVGQNLAEPIKLKLSSGWNAVGFPKTSRSYLAGDLTVADTVAGWDFGLWNTFVKKDNQEYGDNFKILNNRGYILRIGQEGELSP